MENQLLDFDKRGFSRESFNLSFLASHFNQAIKAFNNMNLGTLKLDELPKALTSPKDFIYDKIIETKPELFQGMQVDKNKALELFTIGGLDEFLATAEKTLDLFKGNYVFMSSLNDLPEFYEVGNSGEVVLKQSAIDKVTAYFEKRAETKAAIAICKVANSFIEDLKQSGVLEAAVLKYRGGYKVRMKEFIESLLLVDDDTGAIKVNPELVLKYN